MERFVEQAVERLAERFTDGLRQALAPVIVEQLQKAVERLGAQIERSIERLIMERFPERPERSMEHLITSAKATMVQRIQAMRTEGLSFGAIAARRNAEGVPTLSGRGRWAKGTIANLFMEAERSSGGGS